MWTYFQNSLFYAWVEIDLYFMQYNDGTSDYNIGPLIHQAWMYT